MGAAKNEIKRVERKVNTNKAEVPTKLSDLLATTAYADNAAALLGGLVVGDGYKTAAGAVRIVV